jgi:hypothetical protein
VDKGQVVKISKDKNSIVNREVLTQNWTDWIDYWMKIVEVTIGGQK